MKKKIMYIAVSVMLITGTGCTNALAAVKTTAITSQATTNASDNFQKPAENILMGKVKAISGNVLTLDAIGGEHMGRPSGTSDSTTPPEKPSDTSTKTTTDTKDSSTPSEKPASEQKTVALTSTTVYYKESADTTASTNTSASEKTMPKFIKTAAKASDVTADSMVRVEYEKDETTGNLTAVSVSIMDSSMMNNKHEKASNNTSSTK